MLGGSWGSPGRGSTDVWGGGDTFRAAGPEPGEVPSQRRRIELAG